MLYDTSRNRGRAWLIIAPYARPRPRRRRVDRFDSLQCRTSPTSAELQHYLLSDIVTDTTRSRRVSTFRRAKHSRSPGFFCEVFTQAKANLPLILAPRLAQKNSCQSEARQSTSSVLAAFRLGDKKTNILGRFFSAFRDQKSEIFYSRKRAGRTLVIGAHLAGSCGDAGLPFLRLYTSTICRRRAWNHARRWHDDTRRVLRRRSVIAARHSSSCELLIYLVYVLLSTGLTTLRTQHTQHTTSDSTSILITQYGSIRLATTAGDRGGETVTLHETARSSAFSNRRTSQIVSVTAFWRYASSAAGRRGHPLSPQPPPQHPPPPSVRRLADGRMSGVGVGGCQTGAGRDQGAQTPGVESHR